MREKNDRNRKDEIKTEMTQKTSGDKNNHPEKNIQANKNNLADKGLSIKGPYIEDISQSLANRKQYLEKVVKICKKQINKSPEGHLHIINNCGNDQYYIRIDPKDKNGKYLKKKEINIAKAIAQKEYFKAVDQTATCELELINKFENKFNKQKCEEIYFNVNTRRQPLITPIMLPDDEYVRQWESVEYIGKDIKDMSTDFITEKGEKVRSKSELIIANTLYKMGIPYRYEYPIQLKGYYNGIAYPDFTVLNVRKRKEIVWEHLGKMGDEGYVEDALYRLDKYEQNGYRLGDDLIITMETVAVPLGVSSIKRTIENYLL